MKDSHLFPGERKHSEGNHVLSAEIAATSGSESKTDTDNPLVGINRFQGHDMSQHHQHPSISPDDSTDGVGSVRRMTRRRVGWGLCLSVVRVSMVLVMLGLTLGGALTYRWLDELDVFDVSMSELRALSSRPPADNSLVFDRDGNKIGEFFSSYHVYVPYDQLPKSLIKALVAIEDRNFFRHKGFDPKGMMRALFVHLKGRHYGQGASTITQQVVRHYLLPREKSMQRKLQEISMAIALEKETSKSKILELYANALFLGNGAYGVGAAAMRYFGKPAQELKIHEAALIAGLFQSPSRYNPVRHPKKAKHRQKQVIDAMVETGDISAGLAAKLKRRPLHYKEYVPINTQHAPYFVDYVREEANRLLADRDVVNNQGLRIYTTLDSSIQEKANAAIEAGEPIFKKTEQMAPSIVDKATGKRMPPPVEGSLLSVDPRNGHILSLVGGRDYEKSKYIRPVQALRSPGSAFKPIVFSLALMNKWKWSDVIFVSPVTVNSYRPRTPKEDYLTETTLMRAFYRSMNTPTIEVGEKLGLDPIVEHAKALGIRSEIKQEFGTLLGSSDVTMLDLARVYSVFANGGQLIDPVAITRIEDRTGKILYQLADVESRRKRVLTPEISYLMTEGMRAVLSSGTGYQSGHLARHAVGKTGTANDSTDSWFCGYTPNIVSLVWVGSDGHERLHQNTTGAKTALPIWDTYMSNVLKERKTPSFPRPRGVVYAKVHPKFGNRTQQGMRMWFQRGQEPAAESQAMDALLHLQEQSESTSYRNVFAH